MTNFFEAKVKYIKIDEATGKEKKVNASFLVDAVSYTEAEQRMYKELEQMVSGEFDIPAMKKANYTDVFFTPSDIETNWYKCKVKFIFIDEQAGKEKKVTNTMLIQANSSENAFVLINERLYDMTVDYDIVGVNETNIEEVFVYN